MKLILRLVLTYKRPAMSPVPAPKSAYLCHCLQVTEDDVLNVVSRGMAQSMGDIQACTGAGQGCTACLRRIQQWFDRTAPQHCNG